MKKIFLSTLVAGALMGVTLQAGQMGDAVQKKADRPVKHRTQGGLEYYSKNKNDVKAYVAKELERHHKMVMQKAPKELLMAFGDTYKAIKLIQAKRYDEALKALETADKAFDAGLKKYPDLKMVPLSEQIFISELKASSEQIKTAVDYSRNLLKGYHTQAAAALLATMNDEMDIATSYLPMELYPKAVKKAISALKKKDVKGALDVLSAGFGTIVTVEAAVPLPLLAAQNLVEEASRLDKNNKKEIEKFLRAAKEELRKAYYLGYTDLHPAAYNDLMKQIQGIEKEMGGKNMVEKLYEKLKTSFKKLVGQTYHDSVARKEAQALKNPDSVKGEKAAEAKVEEARSRELFEAKMEAGAFKKEAEADSKKTVK